MQRPSQIILPGGALYNKYATKTTKRRTGLSIKTGSYEVGWCRSWHAQVDLHDEGGSPLEFRVGYRTGFSTKNLSNCYRVTFFRSDHHHLYLPSLDEMPHELLSRDNHPSSPPMKPNPARVRENQRRSRARRKEYLEELEARLRNYETLGVQASIDVQHSARAVLVENARLREENAQLKLENDSLKKELEARMEHN